MKRPQRSFLGLGLVILSGFVLSAMGVRGDEPGLTLAEPVHHLDVLAREPMVVEHPSGALFVAGYGSQVTGTDPEAQPRLWKSVDGGARWSRVDVGDRKAGATGNSDVDLTVGPDGTIYFLSMGFDRSVREGVHISVGVSRDLGETWRWTRLSETRFDDRPWVRVTPDGTAHVIWNDDRGVSHASSTDRGVTWVEHERIHPLGGSSHMASGPNGEIAVRLSPIAASANRFHEGVDLIAVSTDGGATWAKREAPGQRVWDGSFSKPGVIPRWVEPLAWDDVGALFSLWSEGATVVLARSVDSGETWTTWTVFEGAEPSYFPYIVARGEGELAATWFTGSGESLGVHLAHIRVRLGAGIHPTVRLTPRFRIDAWDEREDPPPGRTAAGEYVPVVFLADGRLAVVSPIQDLARDRWGFSWWLTD